MSSDTSREISNTLSDISGYNEGINRKLRLSLELSTEIRDLSSETARDIKTFQLHFMNYH